MVLPIDAPFFKIEKDYEETDIKTIKVEALTRDGDEVKIHLKQIRTNATIEEILSLHQSFLNQCQVNCISGAHLTETFGKIIDGSLMKLYNEVRKEQEAILPDATRSRQGFNDLFTEIMIAKCLRSDAREHQIEHMTDWRKPPQMEVLEWYERIEEAATHINELPTDDGNLLEPDNIKAIFFKSLPESWRFAHNNTRGPNYMLGTKGQLVLFMNKQKEMSDKSRNDRNYNNNYRSNNHHLYSGRNRNYGRGHGG